MVCRSPVFLSIFLFLPVLPAGKYMHNDFYLVYPYLTLACSVPAIFSQLPHHTPDSSLQCSALPLFLLFCNISFDFRCCCFFNIYRAAQNNIYNLLSYPLTDLIFPHPYCDPIICPFFDFSILNSFYHFIPAIIWIFFLFLSIFQIFCKLRYSLSILLNF